MSPRATWSCRRCRCGSAATGRAGRRPSWSRSCSPDRDGVDQQADERVRPGRSTERPDTAVPKATSRWPVNEVSSCAQAACSTVLIVVRCERASSVTARVTCSGTRNDATSRRPAAAGRGHQCRGLEALEDLAPGRLGDVAVLACEPGHEAAVSDRGGQPLAVVAGEDLPAAGWATTSRRSRCGGWSAPGDGGCRAW